ncbi:MAG: hypothetical protein DRN29_06545 [Thermoplasmata archaeon]|nr:MAG: hypothetical protein DRN29_06545 [Thermoplasmata archaeon]
MKKMEFDLKGIKGVIHYVGNDFVVCCHGLYSTKDSKKYVEMAELANDSGLSCIRFDFRGCGESKREFSFNLDDRVNDLKEVIDYIEKKFDDANYALFGSSFGGMVSLSYGSEDKVSSIAILSTPSHVQFEGYEADIIPYAEKCSHVMIMHGLEDDMVPYQHATAIYEKVKQPKKILFFNTDHSFSHRNERVKALNEAIKWFKRYFTSIQK